MSDLQLATPARVHAIAGDLPEEVLTYLGGYGPDDGHPHPRPKKPGVWITWEGEPCWHEMSSWRGLLFEKQDGPDAGFDAIGRNRMLRSWCGETALVAGLRGVIVLPGGEKACGQCDAARSDAGRPDPARESG